MLNKNITLNRLNTFEPNFEERLAKLLQREMIVSDEITTIVNDILQQVRGRGDAAVLEYTNQFDFSVESTGDLLVSQEQMQEALGSISKEQRHALSHAV